jgi:hypothetical protein
MYYNKNRLIVNQSLSGLSEEEVNPEITGAAAGSVFVFVFNTPATLATNQLDAAMKELKGIGKSILTFLYGSFTYEVQGVGFSGGNIRIWVYFKSSENTALSTLIPKFQGILNKHLGTGVAKYSKTILSSGQKTEVRGMVQKVVESINPFGNIDLKSILTLGIIVAGGAFALPHILEVLMSRKKR